ncbi:MAG: NAD(P)H-dependent oxidoreductase subunit E [Candidatus Marinimicrobia bacterium]|nr:NAD(P)H-dependent oxidoreductase subunit E [Candidatus Neomarinimicrobiota bacterium]MBL7047100.1 NAD(P)H-dependent oxidoreductase subunit E [Candidatus Neomarinimicrobiota bacterium]
MDSSVVTDIINKNNNKHGGLISILEDVQAKYGYLPEDVLGEVAKKINQPLIDIYGVATFYKSFRLKPIGKHFISVCCGTACHVRGAQIVVEEFKRQLGINAGETTPDKEFSLETVACLGACALGPIAVVDGHYFSNVSTSKVKKILRNAKAGLDKVKIKTDKRVFPVDVSCPFCNHSLMNPDHFIDGHPSIRVTVSFKRKHGWLALSSLYGSYAVESEYKIPDKHEMHFFCPHCHSELIGGTDCVDCGAPMVSMIVRGSGVIQICSRKGCKGHMLDLAGTGL